LSKQAAYHLSHFHPVDHFLMDDPPSVPEDYVAHSPAAALAIGADVISSLLASREQQTGGKLVLSPVGMREVLLYRAELEFQEAYRGFTTAVRAGAASGSTDAVDVSAIDVAALDANVTFMITMRVNGASEQGHKLLKIHQSVRSLRLAQATHDHVALKVGGRGAMMCHYHQALAIACKTHHYHQPYAISGHGEMYNGRATHNHDDDDA
jgi:hypothetical protein